MTKAEIIENLRTQEISLNDVAAKSARLGDEKAMAGIYGTAADHYHRADKLEYGANCIANIIAQVEAIDSLD